MVRRHSARANAGNDEDDVNVARPIVAYARRTVK